MFSPVCARSGFIGLSQRCCSSAFCGQCYENRPRKETSDPETDIKAIRFFDITYEHDSHRAGWIEFAKSISFENCHDGYRCAPPILRAIGFPDHEPQRSKSGRLQGSRCFFCAFLETSRKMMLTRANSCVCFLYNTSRYRCFDRHFFIRSHPVGDSSPIPERAVGRYLSDRRRKVFPATSLEVIGNRGPR
jgi:hypothetical protein